MWKSANSLEALFLCIWGIFIISWVRDKFDLFDFCQLEKKYQ